MLSAGRMPASTGASTGAKCSHCSRNKNNYNAPPRRNVFGGLLTIPVTEILWFKASPFKGIINKNFPVRQSSSFQGEVILNSQFSILNS